MIPWHHLRENNTETLWDIQMLWRNWCEIHTLMWQSDYYEIHTKKVTVWLLRNKYPYAAIRLVRATYHSTQKHSYFFMKKIRKKNYFRCRCKAALNLNGSAAHNGTICLLFGLINSCIVFVLFFQQIQLLDKSFCRTLALTTLDHLSRNNMVRRW